MTTKPTKVCNRALTPQNPYSILLEYALSPSAGTKRTSVGIDTFWNNTTPEPLSDEKMETASHTSPVRQRNYQFRRTTWS